MHGDISLDNALIGAFVFVIALILAVAAYLDFHAPRSLPADLAGARSREPDMEQDRAPLA